MRRSILAGAALVGVALLTCDEAGWAQLAHHPFAVGASEGGVGHQTALGAWLLGQESRFYLGLTSAVRATKTSMTAVLGLIGLSFAYGVFHAAGPGHGKAVITSYMVSNEVALRRGLVIALLAALLQGAIAAALVAVAAFVFNATAPRMSAAAETLELASDLGIVALGLVLCWRKSAALAAARFAGQVVAPLALAGPAPAGFGGSRVTTRRFTADDGGTSHVHHADCGCGGAHMPDPRQFGAARFDRKAAALAVMTAGARPCSGAILVLVFALSQGLFAVGLAATLAMSLGTALTTGALATAAVYAKDVALGVWGRDGGGGRIAGRVVECVAAGCVLIFGAALLAARLGGISAGG